VTLSIWDYRDGSIDRGERYTASYRAGDNTVRRRQYTAPTSDSYGIGVSGRDDGDSAANKLQITA